MFRRPAGEGFCDSLRAASGDRLRESATNYDETKASEAERERDECRGFVALEGPVPARRLIRDELVKIEMPGTGVENVLDCRCARTSRIRDVRARARSHSRNRCDAAGKAQAELTVGPDSAVLSNDLTSMIKGRVG